MFSLWIQRADFQSRQWAVPSASDAVAAFERHDWAAELRYLSELEEQGAETCPPGLGVEADGERRILHVCPLDETIATVHYHHQGWRRLLGLVPVTRDVVDTLDRTALREVPGLIEGLGGPFRKYMVPEDDTCRIYNAPRPEVVPGFLTVGQARRNVVSGAFGRRWDWSERSSKHIAFDLRGPKAFTWRKSLQAQ